MAAGQDPNGDAAVLVWDAESGDPLHHLSLGTGGLSAELPSVVAEVAILPGKKKLVAYSAAQKLVAVWSTETWELQESIPIGAAGDISVSPDESTIVAVGLNPGNEGYVDPDESTDVTFVDVEEGKVAGKVEATGVTNVAFSPDGSTLAMADQNGFLRLRSADGREPNGPLLDLGGGATALAWRTDGRLIAASLGAGGVVLADPESGEVSEPLPYEPYAPSVRLEWSADGRRLAALNGIGNEEGGYDPGPAAIWTLDTPSLERRNCELDPCQATAEGSSPGSQLGNASSLEPVEMVYREEGDLLAADLDGEKARIGYVESEYTAPQITYDWSEHGLAWSAPGQIAVLLAGEQKPRSWSCACSGVAWDGDQVVSLEEGGRRLVRIDPREDRLRTRLTRDLPPYLPGLLGIVGETPIVAAFEREPDRGTSSALFALEPDGTAARLTGDAHGSVFLRWPSSSPRSLAFLASLSGGVCYSTSNVGVVSARESGEISLGFPRSPLGTEPTWIRSLQVAGDGRVSAAIAPIGCSDQGYPVDGVPLAERYLLETGRWQPTGAEGFDVQAAGDVEVIQESEALGEPGPLFVDDDGERQEIAPEVEGLVVRP